MKTIYCISGFGADHRVFGRLNLKGYNVHAVNWLEPLPHEKIEAYAHRLAAVIQDPRPILLGFSFGGMMAIELAKFIATDRVIIISSIKTFRELPGWMRLTGKLHLDQIVPLKTFGLIEPIENHNLGVETKEEKSLVRAYRKSVSQRYTNWAVHQILNWKNEWQPERLVHIHGARDHIFPIRNIQADYRIEDGGHFMIMNRSDKVNNILQEILQLPS